MVQVNVAEGLLEGDFVKKETGSYYSFKGIPYAEPPVGDLRFQPPQTKTPWKGVRSAKECGSRSYQFDMFTLTPNVGSEDCLYLNVYTPDLKPKIPLPVMFFIHGGGFYWGSGTDDFYGPEFLVRQDVVLVTFNYRLGILGYLCLDTKEIPGNAGMKDQVAALRWAKKNIHNFGGDPNNITIFGQSAGAGSVGVHLVSHMTKGLFKRAILQSGGPTHSWVQAFEPRERALKVAKRLGCYSEDDQELYAFFKSQPMEALLAHKCPITFADVDKFDIAFNIVSEKNLGQERYFFGDIHKVLREGGIHDGVEIIVGNVEHEGHFMFSASFCKNMDTCITEANEFLETFVPKTLSRKLPIKEQLEVGRKMKKFYCQNQRITRDSWEKLAEIQSFSTFIYETFDFLKYALKHKCYLYQFTCKSERNLFKTIYNLEPILGGKPVTIHGDDTAYLFPVKHMNQKLDLNSKEFKLIEQMTRLWTNFAKYGNPTPDSSLGAKWEPYCLQHERYLDIGETLVLGSKPNHEEHTFWNSIFNEYL